MARAGAQADDRPQERESPVRRAHAQVARRHGRAAAPGYLGVPADEVEPELREPGEDEGDAEQSEDEGDAEQSPEQNPQTRSPRARASSQQSRGKASASRSQARGSDRRRAAHKGDDGGETSQSRSRSRGASESRGQGSGGSRGQGASRSRSQGSSSTSKGSQRSRGQSDDARKRKVQAATAKAKKAKEKARESRESTKAASRRAASGQKSKGGRKGKSAGAAAGSVKSKVSTGAGKSASRAVGRTKSKSSSGGKSVAAAADNVKSKVSSTVEGGEHAFKKTAVKAGARVAGTIAKRILKVGFKVTKKAIIRASEAGAEAITERSHRLPIQKSIDVAVPVDVAWEQWMEFEYFPEGTHRAKEVEREDDVLEGALDGAHSPDWRAEIIDEREGESFGWRSTEGSDSAGLVTFHELSDRLTRIELNLDVRPLHVSEAAALMLHIADRRVEAELRRFKAHVELLDPDTYEELLPSENGDGSGEDMEDNDGSEEA